MATTGTGTGTGGAPAPKAVTSDSYAPIPGEEAAVTAGKDYGTQSTIQDTDKRNGKARSLFNIPAARA